MTNKDKLLDKCISAFKQLPFDKFQDDSNIDAADFVDNFSYWIRIMDEAKILIEEYEAL